MPQLASPSPGCLVLGLEQPHMVREGHPASNGALGSLSILGQVSLPGASPGVRLMPRLRLARTGGVHSPCWWLMPRLPWGRILPTALGAEGPGRLGSHSVLPRGVRGAGAQALNIP